MPVTITQGPTLANPDALTDLGELRDALRLANTEILRQLDLIASLNSAVQAMARDMAALTVLHMTGNDPDLKAALDIIVQKIGITVPSTPGVH